MWHSLEQYKKIFFQRDLDLKFKKNHTTLKNCRIGVQFIPQNLLKYEIVCSNKENILFKEIFK